MSRRGLRREIGLLEPFHRTYTTTQVCTEDKVQGSRHTAVCSLGYLPCKYPVVEIQVRCNQAVLLSEQLMVVVLVSSSGRLYGSTYPKDADPST